MTKKLLAALCIGVLIISPACKRKDKGEKMPKKEHHKKSMKHHKEGMKKHANKMDKKMADHDMMRKM